MRRFTDGRIQKHHGLDAGPFMRKMLQALHDSYSKWIDVYPTTDITSNATINSQRSSFSTHGLPLAIVNDNGLSFVSDKFRNFCDLNSIEHILPTYINPLQTAQRKELCKHLKHQ